MADNEALVRDLTAMGFARAGNVWCGYWKGYAVTIRPAAGSAAVDLAVRRPKNDNQLVKAVKAGVKSSGTGGVTGYICSGQSFTFSVRLRKSDPYREQLTAFLDLFERVLRENGAPPAATCAICGREAPDSLCLTATYQPVHRMCAQDASHQVMEKAEDNRNNGSFLGGLVGAVLGMLVGLIPNLLSILFLKYIVALLFALVPLASMWGYRKFRGVQNAAGAAIVVVLSLLGVLVLEYAVIGISVARELSLPLGRAMSVTAQYIFTPEGFVDLLRDSASAFLFMILGIFIAWKNLMQTNDAKVKAAGAAMATLRPIPDAGEEAAE